MPASICLIRPPAVESFRFATTSIALPLGLAYISAALKAAGHDPCIVDAVGLSPGTHTRYCKGYLVGLRSEQIVARIPADTDIIGITIVFTHEWPAVVRLIDVDPRALSSRQDRDRRRARHVDCRSFRCCRPRPTSPCSAKARRPSSSWCDAIESRKPLGDIAGIAYREAAMRPRQPPPRTTHQHRRDPPARLGTASIVVNYHRHRFVGGMYSSRDDRADPGDARLPLSMHVLLGAQHVAAALDSARPDQGRGRDRSLRQALRRREFSVPGPDRDHPEGLDQGVLQGADRGES